MQFRIFHNSPSLSVFPSCGELASCDPSDPIRGLWMFGLLCFHCGGSWQVHFTRSSTLTTIFFDTARTSSCAKKCKVNLSLQAGPGCALMAWSILTHLMNAREKPHPFSYVILVNKRRITSGKNNQSIALKEKEV